jgi:hypothetical protein
MKNLRLPLPHCVAALLALLALVSCRPWFTRQVSGEILALEGTPMGTWGGKRFHLAEQTAIFPGMTIAVPPASRVDLLLLPGILMELQPDTKIEIQRLRLSRDGDESIRPMIAREATIRLLHGALFATVGRAPTRSGLTIETQLGSVKAGSGRTFKIVSKDSKLRIVSARGRVAFASQGEISAIKINPGYFVVLDGANGIPQAAAKSGAQAQKEVAESIKAEKQLLQLERENQTSFRRWRDGPIHPAAPPDEG